MTWHDIAIDCHSWQKFCHVGCWWPKCFTNNLVRDALCKDIYFDNSAAVLNNSAWTGYSSKGVFQVLNSVVSQRRVAPKVMSYSKILQGYEPLAASNMQLCKFDRVSAESLWGQWVVWGWISDNLPKRKHVCTVKFSGRVKVFSIACCHLRTNSKHGTAPNHPSAKASLPPTAPPAEDVFSGPSASSISLVVSWVFPNFPLINKFAPSGRVCRGWTWGESLWCQRVLVS